MQNPRLICADIVQKILEEKVFFNTLKGLIDKENLPFVNALVLDTLRNLTALEKLLGKYLKRKIAHKNRRAKYLLLLAIDEILNMNTAPYAVINETVSNVKKCSDRFVSGMANAVLRKICADAEQERKWLQSANKIPESFGKILQNSGYDAEQIFEINKAVSQIPPIDLTVKQDCEKWAKKLQAHILPSGSLRLKQNVKIEQLEGFESGDWWVQDCSAALAVKLLGNLSQKDVVDLCAAPGGKTAQLLAAGANVLALDISAARLAKLHENIKRLHLEKNLTAMTSDALEFLRKNKKLFDVILLDAPCSASGIMRRHPEVLHLKTMEDVRRQAKIQQKMLELAGESLKTGGFLLYCVCSIATMEAEEQIAQFLQTHKNFQTVPICQKDISIFATWENDLITKQKTLRTKPYYESQNGGMDAFFICLMQRIN